MARKYFLSRFRFALSRSPIPASLIALTNRSWSTPYLGSTRPLACGLWARINSAPKAFIARSNRVCSSLRADVGHALLKFCGRILMLFTLANRTVVP